MDVMQKFNTAGSFKVHVEENMVIRIDPRRTHSNVDQDCNDNTSRN